MHYNKYVNNFIRMAKSHPGFEQYVADDPTVMGFNLFFNFESMDSPLLSENTVSPNGVYSAARYLQDINNKVALDHLLKFRRKLRYMTVYTPYYWQELSGLEEVYKFEPQKAWNQTVLGVKTLESIDLKVGSLAYHYLHATYDVKSRKFIIPQNLRYFEFDVVIAEIRGIRSFIEGTRNDTAMGVQGWKQKEINNVLNMWTFHFSKSEFDFSKSNPFLGTISNSTLSYADNKFDIKCGRFIDNSMIGWSDTGFINLGSEARVKSDPAMTDYGKSHIMVAEPGFDAEQMRVLGDSEKLLHHSTYNKPLGDKLLHPGAFNRSQLLDAIGDPAVATLEKKAFFATNLGKSIINRGAVAATILGTEAAGQMAVYAENRIRDAVEDSRGTGVTDLISKSGEADPEFKNMMYQAEYHDMVKKFNESGQANFQYHDSKGVADAILKSVVIQQLGNAINTASNNS